MSTLASYRSDDMALRTPPPKSRGGKSKKKGGKGVVINTGMDEASLHGLLENFDLELESKERQFRLHLQTVLSAFNLRQVSEIARIPPKILNMTVEDVEKHWGGNWAGTLGRMAMERQREEEVGGEEKEKALREGVKGKRKRVVAAAAESSPERTNKNARKGITPLKTRPAASIPLSASKRKLGKKAVPFVSANPVQKGPSALPQNHIFNPSLPPTPLRKMNPSDVLLTVNGSPIANPLSKSMRERQADAGPSTSTSNFVPSLLPQTKTVDAEASETEQSESGSEDDLPDADAYAARLLSQSQSQSQPSQASRSNPSGRGPKSKRNPSLLWRESLQNDGPAPIDEEDDADPTNAAGETATDGQVKAHVRLPNGQFIEFDPLALDRAVMNQELTDRGLSAKEREEVGRLLQAEVVRALTQRMSAWAA